HQKRRKAEQSPQEVMNEGRSANVRDIRTTLAIKHNQRFLLTSHTGDVKRTQLGMGIYFRDTEYLDEVVLKLNGEECLSVMADASKGDEAHCQLANVEMTLENGEELKKERISV